MRTKDLTMGEARIALNRFREGKVMFEILADYESNRTYFESDTTHDGLNDLQELGEIITAHEDWIKKSDEAEYESPLEKLNHIWEFIDAAQFIASPEEIERIPLITDFRENYPMLYDCLITWAWG